LIKPESHVLRNHYRRWKTSKQESFKMTMKSPVPVVRTRSPAVRESNPFTSLQQEIDRLFDGLSTTFAGRMSKDLAPTMDIAETDKDIEITVELPGMQEKDVQLNLADNILTIRGEKKNEREETKKDYHLVERSYGSFMRTVELPAGVDPDQIKAEMAKGVLKVAVSKPAPAQTKKIDVKAAA
jgi:HSP20 family protein